MTANLTLPALVLPAMFGTPATEALYPTDVWGAGTP